MTFKRPQLRKARTFVNAISTLAVIFSLNACGGKKEEAPEVEIIPPALTVELPAIWTTPALPAPVRDIGISPGFDPIMLVAMADNTVQMFDLDGDRLTEPSELGLRKVADGFNTDFEGIRITLFPSIDTKGRPVLLGFNGVMTEPLGLGFPIETGALGGLCATRGGPQKLFRLAYWTSDSPETLVTGDISQQDGELLWDEVSKEKTSGKQNTCQFSRDRKAITGDAFDSTRLSYPSASFDIRLNRGKLSIKADQDEKPLTLRPGITVQAPERVVAVSAETNVVVGGYSNGIIAVAGPWRDGDHRVVYVDPAELVETAPNG